MKQPLQALLIADAEPQAQCALGDKTISIREGTRAYLPGESMVLCCHVTNWCMMVEVTEVKHCSLTNVSGEELQDDGFNDINHALASMQRFYPCLTLDSQVTVIRWRLK